MNVLDSVSIRGLRATHFEQLYTYLTEREDSGWYYGNIKQFNTRHEELKQWLVEIISRARDHDNIIPKEVD